MTTQLTRQRRAGKAWLLLSLILTVPLHAHHLPPGLEEVDEFDNAAAFQGGMVHAFSGSDHWLLAVLGGALLVLAMKRSRRLAAGLLGATALWLGVSHAYQWSPEAGSAAFFCGLLVGSLAAGTVGAGLGWLACRGLRRLATARSGNN